MGKPLTVTNEAPRFDPVLLQCNLQQAAALWLQLLQRWSTSQLKAKPLPTPGDFAFNNALAMWGVNLLHHPHAVLEANRTVAQQQLRLWQGLGMRLCGFAGASLSDVPSRDRRFKDPAWQDNPLGEVWMQSYLNVSGYWKTLFGINQSMPKHEADKASFFLNNWVDALAPNNYPQTNPQVWQAIRDTNGENLVKGLENLLHDFQDGELRIRMTDMQAFKLGQDIATTPGQVVFRNELIELIQYTPTTAQVHQRPLLIVPPWINKYYILDLREQNSYVKWAVDQGHTVFMISWLNPGSAQSGFGFDEYLKLGTLAAMDAVEQATGEPELNVAAYCLGGTLMGMTLAWLAANQDERVKSATFFTTLLDFAEPGEIGVFIDEAQVQSLEARMDSNGGYLDGKNMGSAFNLLRSNDLIWSFFVNLYLLGKDPMPFDLLFWNSDSTRMPATMHSFYLRNMYLHNRLCEPCGISVLGKGLDLGLVQTPVYFVSAHDDHIAPWRSTYAGTQLFGGSVRFVLGQSGHIAGIVNPASANKYGHWVNDTLADTPDAWFKQATLHKKSWWHDWDQWVSAHVGDSVVAREPGDGALPALCAAPGTYVYG